ncbi:LisH domain-containing protein armc9 [Thoreauomyces humboldtii]|nr:LisH domain-containing protein armc9 [Thoreauomyces humboldtii]
MSLGMALDTELKLNGAIREYLVFADYKATTVSFDIESEEKGRPADPGEAAGGFQTVIDENTVRTRGPHLSKDECRQLIMDLELKSKFIKAFRTGDRSAFFALWDEYFPRPMRSTDALFQKLEFLASIYFAVFPVHPGVDPTLAKSQNIVQTMEPFKQFLETRGSELCKTPQFLSYYALPYVPDPLAHPSFKDIFEVGWTTDLEGRLQVFLKNALRAVVKPMLVTLIGSESSRGKLVEEIEELKRDLKESHAKESFTADRHRDLQSDYHNLITIASELVQTLTACINGEKITPSYLAGVCQRLATFKQSNQRKSSVGQSTSPLASTSQPVPLRKSSSSAHHRAARAADRTDPKQGPTPRASMSKPPLAPTATHLDYTAIASDLEADNEKSDLLLEALRVLATKDKKPPEIRHILATYVAADFLQVKAGKPLLESLLKSVSSARALQTTMLLNVLTTTSAGREYLVQSPTLIPTLLSTLKTEAPSSPMHHHTLLTLQKLSLRRSAQSQMNNLDTITYLFEVLATDDLDALSDRTVEYTAALIMNLCLRTKGKRECCGEGREAKVLKVLSAVMEVESLQVKTYVNGTLYSLFTEASLRDAARAMGMEDILKYMRESEDEQLVGQIDLVLGQLSNEEPPDDQDTDSDAISEDGEEEDDDDEEDEGDEDEDLTTAEQEVEGPDGRRSSSASVDLSTVLRPYVTQRASCIPTQQTQQRRRDVPAGLPSDAAQLTRPTTPQLYRSTEFRRGKLAGPKDQDGTGGNELRESTRSMSTSNGKLGKMNHPPRVPIAAEE